MITYIRNKFRKYILTLLDNVIDKGDIAHYVEQAVDLEQVAQYAAKHLDLADLVAESLDYRRLARELLAAVREEVRR